MILVLENSFIREQKRDLCLRLQKKGFFTRLVEQYGQTILSVDGPNQDLLLKDLSKWSGIKKIIPGQHAYYLASRECQKKNSIIKVNSSNGDVTFGGKKIPIISGPCALETEETAIELAKACKSTGTDIFRAMLFKPRSSPYSFQGLKKLGVPILRAIKELTGLAILTEVRDPLETEAVYDYVDMVQVGTRNMSNFQLLKHLGQIEKPVLLKRGMGASLEELLSAAEYLIVHGNSDVILCERGIRTFDQFTRFTLDIGAIPSLKEITHLPVIIDPSHASGKSSLVPSLSWAGIAAGVDGLMIEVHQNPKEAYSDGAQAISIKTLGEVIQRGKSIASIFGRELG